MKRPLVWVGIAYVTGEALAAAGCPLFVIRLAAILFITILLTGQRSRRAASFRFLFVVPFIFMSGFIVYSRAASPQTPAWADSGTSCLLTGYVRTVTEKEHTAEIEVIHAGKSSGSGQAPAATVVLYTDPDMAAGIRPGDRVSFSGAVQLPERASNPGQFDRRSYLHSRGIWYICYPERVRCLSSSLSWKVILLALRGRLSSVFLRLFGENEGSVACAMVLGETTYLPSEIRGLYRVSGIIHILAISGLHVSLAGNALFRLLIRLRMPQNPAALVSIFTVLSYGVLTGSSPTTARAVIMFCVSMTALLLGRTPDMMSSASLAALILFTRHPLMITQPGMQFSFGAICALGMLYPAYRKFFSVKKPDKAAGRGKLVRFLSFAGPSAAVTLATLPVTAWHYSVIPLLSLPLNLIVIPAMSALLPLCFLTGLTGLFSMPAAGAAGGGAFTLIRMSLLLCRAADRLPFVSWCCGRPPVPVMILYYVLLLLPLLAGRLPRTDPGRAARADSGRTARADSGRTARADSGRTAQADSGRTARFDPGRTARFDPGRTARPLTGVTKRLLTGITLPLLSVMAAQLRRRARRCIFLCSVLCLILIAVPWRRFPDQVSFLDVGQGDCIVLRTGQVTCLVDSGSSSRKEIGKYILLPYLHYCGLDHVDYAFVSHADQDHISGIRELLEDGRIRHLVLTSACRDDPAAQELVQLAKEQHTKISGIQTGDHWSFGSWTYTCLYPDAGEHGEDRNALSMVLRVQKDRFRLLLTGDISAEEEQKLKPEDTAHCSVLKCAHHGSRFASSEDFLQKANPSVTVISCGAGNSYGHPAPETLNRLRAAGSRILLTMEEGAVLLRTDGRRINIQGWLRN